MSGPGRGVRWTLCLLLLAVGCSLTAAGQSLMESRARAQGFRDVTLQSGELSIHYWRGGEGDPLLVLHGFGGDAVSTWSAQMGPLKHAARLLLPDLLWFGASRGGVPSLDTQVRAQLAVLDAEGVATTDVMGISYGGFVALRLWQVAPERVRRVILVDSPGPLFTEADEAAMVARFHRSSVHEIFVPRTPDDVTVMLDLLLYKDVKLPGAIRRDVLNNGLAANPDEKHLLLDDMHARRGSTEWPDLTGHPAPLVIWGEFDEVFPLAIGRAVATRIGAELRVIPNTAHGPSTERPRAFNAEVLRYLAQASTL